MGAQKVAFLNVRSPPTVRVSRVRLAGALQGALPRAPEACCQILRGADESLNIVQCSGSWRQHRLRWPAPSPRHGRDVRACRRQARTSTARTCTPELLHSDTAAQLSDADDEVHDQEQLERRALAAGATALGRAVNSLTECDVCK